MTDLSVLGKNLGKYLTPIASGLGESLSPVASQLVEDLRPALNQVIEEEVMPKAKVYVISGLAMAGLVGAVAAMLWKR